MSRVITAFYTVSHRIEGELIVNERLSEKLNDPLTDFIELRNCEVWSLGAEGDAAPSTWPIATIPKSGILISTLDTEEHENRQSRIDKKQAKTGSEVGCIVGSIEVYGTGHLQFSGSATRVLTAQLQPFFPVTEATLVLSQQPTNNQINTGLALVNREMVRAFALSG